MAGADPGLFTADLICFSSWYRCKHQPAFPVLLMHPLFSGRCDDINQSLVGSLLELLTGIFVLVNCTKDCYYLFLRWKRYWSAHRCSVLLYSFDNFLCRCIYYWWSYAFSVILITWLAIKKSRLLFALLRVRQAVTVHLPVCVLMFAHGRFHSYRWT